MTSGNYERFHQFEFYHTFKNPSGRCTFASGTYRKSVLLVSRSRGWRELRGVGRSELQAVALHGSILGHVGEQGLQRHVLLFPKVVSSHHTAHKVHLRGKRQTFFFWGNDHRKSAVAGKCKSCLTQPKLLLVHFINTTAHHIFPNSAKGNLAFVIVYT